LTTRWVYTNMNPKIALRRDDSRKVYDLLARYYDELTGHHDYERWLSALLPPLEGHGLGGSKLLDLGCGTGKSTMPMLRRGWSVTACDNSTEMLAVLESKAGDRVRTEIADILALPALGQFDLVLCLGDVLNYCAADGRVVAALEGIERNLRPGGLVLFDLNTLLTYATLYSEHQVMTVDGHQLVWRGGGDGDPAAGGLFESEHEVIEPDGTRAKTVHRQRHLDEETVRAAIEAAGLDCLDVFGQGFDAVLEQPLDERRHTKSIFIAKACQTREERR